MLKVYKYRRAQGEVILCGICGEPIRKARRNHMRKRGGKGGMTVDYIRPLGKEGTDTVDNMQPAHSLCNEQKGDKYE